MLGKLEFIGANEVHARLSDNINIATNLMNVHVIMEDNQNKVLGEITSIDGKKITIALLGEFSGNTFFSGVIRKPTLNAQIRFISKEELDVVVGNRTAKSFLLGDSPLYNGYPIYADINEFFSNHFAIFGNSGSGKSCGIARLLQNLFMNKDVVPIRSNFLIFDAYGEYHNAFERIGEINSNFHFKYYTTNTNDTSGETLKIPVWLLKTNDLALFLSASEHSQLTLIDEMRRLANIFSSQTEASKAYKNHLIAKAVMSVLYSNQTSSRKRNDVFNILESCSTAEFNLDTSVQGLGYSRTFRELFTIDSKGEFPERNLLIEYIAGFINDSIEKSVTVEANKYGLLDLEKALNFVLISDGILHNQDIAGGALALKVRLHTLVIGPYAKYFEYPELINEEQYINSLITASGYKAQIVNFNFEDVDNWFAQAAIKFYSNLIFDYCKSTKGQNTLPFNILFEEAHRYIQKDNDQYLLGYNIFERIAKEGRKYGVVLGILSQRPVEISETIISQVSNFLIFRMTHPLDVEYIKQMLPNISEEIVEKQKSLQPGTCISFGKAFRIPQLIHFNMPNPAPFSSNFDMATVWNVK